MDIRYYALSNSLNFNDDSIIEQHAEIFCKDFDFEREQHSNHSGYFNDTGKCIKDIPVFSNDPYDSSASNEKAVFAEIKKVLHKEPKIAIVLLCDYCTFKKAILFDADQNELNIRVIEYDLNVREFIFFAKIGQKEDALLVAVHGIDE